MRVTAFVIPLLALSGCLGLVAQQPNCQHDCAYNQGGVAP